MEGSTHIDSEKGGGGGGKREQRLKKEKRHAIEQDGDEKDRSGLRKWRETSTSYQTLKSCLTEQEQQFLNSNRTAKEARKREIQSQARRLRTVIQALGKQVIHKFEGNLGYTVRPPPIFKRDGGGSGVKWSTQQAGEQGRLSAQPIDDFRQTALHREGICKCYCRASSNG